MEIEGQGQLQMLSIQYNMLILTLFLFCAYVLVNTLFNTANVEKEEYKFNRKEEKDFNN